MPNGFHIRGDAQTPYHLSVGVVLLDNEKIAVIKKPDDTFTLLRETMYSQESVEEAVMRGVIEEIGVHAEVVDSLGTLITHFDRQDGTNVEKATIYFLANKVATATQSLDEDELDDEVVWLTPSEAITKLKEQDNQEYLIIERISQT